MKVKKTLAILEILCPAFFDAEAEDGSVNYNTPTGHLLFLPYRCKLLYKAIWNPDNEVLTAAEKMFRAGINIIFSVALIPIILVIWIISQLVFAMHYDYRQRTKGNKSYLLLKYLTLATLLGSLLMMTISYYHNQNINIDITPAVASITEPERKSERVIVRKNKRLVDTESGHKQSNVSDDCNSSTSVEPEPEITTAAITLETVDNVEDGYSIKRKER